MSLADIYKQRVLLILPPLQDFYHLHANLASQWAGKVPGLVSSKPPAFSPPVHPPRFSKQKYKLRAQFKTVITKRETMSYLKFNKYLKCHYIVLF